MNILLLSPKDFPEAILILQPGFCFLELNHTPGLTGLHLSPKGAIIETFSSFPTFHIPLLFCPIGNEVENTGCDQHYILQRINQIPGYKKSSFPLRTSFSLLIIPAIIDWLVLKGYYAKSLILDLCSRCSFWWGNVCVIACCSNPTALIFFPWKNSIPSHSSSQPNTILCTLTSKTNFPRGRMRKLFQQIFLKEFGLKKLVWKIVYICTDS